MYVVDPTGILGESRAQSSSGTRNLTGATVGFLWNGKPNADKLLRAVETRLRRDFGIGRSMWADKAREAEGPGGPASEEMLSRLSKEADFVLTASGD
jgi:hypothetical protein